METLRKALGRLSVIFLLLTAALYIFGDICMIVQSSRIPLEYIGITNISLVLTITCLILHHLIKHRTKA